MQQTNEATIKSNKLYEYFHSTKWKKFRAKYVSFNNLANVGWKVVRFVILFGLCFMILFPFVVKIIQSVKSYQDMMDPTVQYIPKHFTLENIQAVVEKMGYWQALINTVFVALGTGILQTITSATVGYGFARFKFKFNGLLFFLVIFMLIVPPETIIIPFFLQFRFPLGINFSLLGSPAPLLILALTCTGLKNGLYIFLFRQFFRGMPKELEEASYIDGCGAFQTYGRIMLPEANSIMVTVFLLSFSWSWTDQIFNGLFLQSSFPVLATVAQTVGVSETDKILSGIYTQTGALLAVLPVAIVFIVAQKFFVQSIDKSGLVG